MQSTPLDFLKNAGVFQDLEQDLKEGKRPPSHRPCAVDFSGNISSKTARHTASHTTLLQISSRDAALDVAELERYAADYLEDCECAGQSPATITGKREVVEKLLWFLRRNDAKACSVAELRRFII